MYCGIVISLLIVSKFMYFLAFLGYQKLVKYRLGFLTKLELSTLTFINLEFKTYHLSLILYKDKIGYRSCDNVDEYNTKLKSCVI